MGNEVIYVIGKLLERANAKYSKHPGTHDSQNDVILQELIPELFLMIEAAVLKHGTVQTSEYLDIGGFYDDETDEAEQNNYDNNSPDWEDDGVIQGGRVFSLEQMKNIVQFYDTCVGDKFKQTQRRYPRVKHTSYIYNFKTYIANNGRRRDKLKQLEKSVMKTFHETRNSFAYVSEADLRRWGVLAAKELDLHFDASVSWLFRFKKRNRIVSRKVTKFVTMKELLEHPQIQEQANEFVEAVRIGTLDIPSKHIFNFDQSGFNYEKSSSRTLSTKGEKDTLARVQSAHATSHSYSVMPMLSMAGTLSPRLLLCLQETGGELGPRVAANLKVPSNIFIVSSKSGKLDKKIMKRWVNECVVPEFADVPIALLHDSWTGQVDQAIYKDLKFCKRFVLPPKTTSIIQPEDVYFFRQYKIIFRKISDRMMLSFPDEKLSTRDNVIKIQSLIYNQLQSAKFCPMLRYAWYACGYVDERPGYFYNVNEILFNMSNYDCDEFGCNAESFIICSHCESQLCIRHFFLEGHFHEIANLTTSQD